MKQWDKLCLLSMYAQTQDAEKGINFLLDHADQMKGRFDETHFSYEDAAAIGSCLRWKEKIYAK